MIGRTIKLFIGLGLIGAVSFVAFLWFGCRIYVPENMCAVLTRKTGTDLPAGQLVATQPGQKGIQEEALGPGRYFRNPFSYGWELKPQIVVPSGNPATWEWMRSNDQKREPVVKSGQFQFKGEFPKIGVVVRKMGQSPPPDQVIVTRDSGMKGILAEVLTPGTYKLNPYMYEVELHPAIVIPSGFVGVVTNLFGESPTSQVEHPSNGDRADVPNSEKLLTDSADSYSTAVQPLANLGERGTLRDVLQPGIYFINPKVQKVTLLEIGYNEFSQVRLSSKETTHISFPSDTGYLIHVGVTVVWGIDPKHAAEIINEFGNVDGVIEKVIGPQLRSICRNIGSNFAARDFIQGEKREQFQKDLTTELKRVCRSKNLEVLLALVREIEVHSPAETKGEAVEDLKRTIQQSRIAIESQITKEKQRDAAIAKAQLEEEKKKIEIAKETIKADTRVMVANIMAEGEKKAAETDAQASLDVATIQQEVALLDAKRIEILGQAKADVEKLKKGAEAKGYQLLVNAFGDGHAYNLYTFAENFQPESIRLFFAGDGTFWTDLNKFEELGAAKLLKPTSQK